GNLLRFDPKDLRLQQEVRPEAAITLLSVAKEVGVLAACADGRVFRVDPKTLKLTAFAKLPAAPQWLTGFRDPAKQKDGVLAVVQTGAGAIEIHRLGFGQPTVEKHKVPQFPRGEISAFLLDGKARLWLGKDSG